MYVLSKKTQVDMVENPVKLEKISHVCYNNSSPTILFNKEKKLWY